MNQRGIGSYQKTETLGKSPLELLLMVYAGAEQSLREAAELFESADRAAGREKLARAEKFVVHLYTTLDPERGGEVARNLAALYVFVIEQIKIASATGDVTIIKNLRAIIENVRSGWRELSETEKVNEV